jgi:pyruvyltransferase
MSILSRVEKFRRLARWRFAVGATLPVWWHVGRPNFGDDINPSFFEAVGGRKVRFATDPRQPHLLGAGSILAKATPASIVCGSGLLRPPSGSACRPGRLVAVRGEKTAEALSAPADTLLGDPLVLIDTLVEQQPKRHPVGIIPHVRSVARWQALARPDARLLDPGLEPWRLIREIAACEVILSQSLHGLIVADAMKVPNVWIAPSELMAGRRFKFDDYFSTLDAPKDCVPEAAALAARPETWPARVSRYRFSKTAYRARLAEVCRDFTPATHAPTC